ncbi:glycosyl hydrolase family 18 protein [Cohnella herbarum]|uniref:chitinase n=1 Tax=Cohnella herbarum TaxID=2728023 RepID=A0A7Z2VPT0_9BACL|nr:glycosyl hydrolase family 18 protein [Cohnella herbarum]QJD87251.1 glycoside hydrolase [Cohnella herbarum]
MVHALIESRRTRIIAFWMSLTLVLSLGLFPPKAFAVEILPPQQFTAVEVTANSVTFTWNRVEGLNSENNDPDYGYDLWNAATGDWRKWLGSSPTADNANVLTGTYGGLLADTEYSFYLTPGKKTPSDDHSTKKSAIVTIKTAPGDPNAEPKPPLAPPHNLRVTDVTESGITLKWTGSPGANGYDMYITGGNPSYAGIWDGSNSYTFPVSPATVVGAVYTFEVAAQNLPAVSVRSNPVKIAWGQLQAPQDLQIVTATRTTASLGWAPTPGATSYDIFRNDEFIGTSDSNRYVSSGLTEGESYSFKVVAKNRLWQSPPSSETTVVPGGDYNLITYYTSWSVYERAFQPTDIDTSKLTHINYAFSDLCWKGYGSGGVKCQNEDIPLQKDYVFDGEMVIGDQEVDLQNMETLRTIRAQRPHLNLMVSVGGWSWSKNFSNMAKTEETRRAFANSAVKFLREYRLDGLDIDWEYPVEGGLESNARGPEDKENFLLMVRTVREALDAAGSTDDKYYLLTIASAQSDAFVANADLAHSSAYLDFINIMTYDYSGTWEALAHHNAPLYHDGKHPKSSAPRNNVSAAAEAHLNGGVPSYKLVLGVPFYGIGWLGCPPNGQYLTCEGGAIPEGESFGTYESRAFDFDDIEANYLNKNGYVRHWNEAAKVPYLYNSEKRRFITYDDEQSMMYKTSLIKSLNLAGAMSWDISQDGNKTLSTVLARDLPITGTVNSEVEAPKNILAKSIGNTSIQIKWDASSNVSGYDVLAGHTWIGYTTQTEFNIPGLTPNTAYRIKVIAVRKDGDTLKGVSSASNIDLKTANLISGSGGGGGGSPATDPNGKGDPAANPLKAKVTKEGNKAIFSLDTAEAVKSIQASKATTSQIAVNTDAEKSEALVAMEVIDAIAAKGEQANLSLIVNQVEYRIPIKALKLGSDIASLRITLQAADPTITADFKAESLAQGFKIITNPWEFKIEALTSGGKATEIEDFGNVYVSRFFKISDSGIHKERATGIVYTPGNKKVYPVPTLFAASSDGTIIAELKRTGNSIYAIVESAAPDFADTNLKWAKPDIEKAVAKMIASGVSQDAFGSKSEITRAEFVSIVVKALGLVPGVQKSPFKDVNDRTKFAEDIITAVKYGFIQGRSADVFDPSGPITRQEIAAVLEKAMTFGGIANTAELNVLTPYADRSDVSGFAVNSLAFMVDRKILTGVTPTKLAPLSKVTKAEATVTAMRMLRALKLID